MSLSATSSPNRSCRMASETSVGLRVRPLGTDVLGDSFDLIVYSIGYEKRSGWLVANLRDSPSAALGVRFGHNETLSFGENLEAARLRGDRIEQVTEHARIGPVLLE